MLQGGLARLQCSVKGYEQDIQEGKKKIGREEKIKNLELRQTLGVVEVNDGGLDSIYLCFLGIHVNQCVLILGT